MGKTKGERAQTTAEFVLVVPFLLLLFFLIVDFGWLLKNWIVVTNTAREATRCAIVDSCVLDGLTVTPEELAQSRIASGGAGGGGTPQVTMHYVEQNGTAGANAGDSFVLCVRANNRWISPVVPFLAMISGGAGGALDDSGLPLAAREEMIFERTPTFAVDVGDGTCDFD